MLAFIGNMSVGETLMIAVVAVLVFGGRLPEVAREAMRMFYRARRSLDEIRREANIGGGLRDVEREIRNSIEGPRRPVGPPPQTKREDDPPSRKEEEDKDREPTREADAS